MFQYTLKDVAVTTTAKRFKAIGTHVFVLPFHYKVCNDNCIDNE